jgi:hypothetical protein
MTDQPPTLRDLAYQAAEQFARQVIERTDALLDHAPPDVIGTLRLQIDPPVPSWAGQDDWEWTVETDPDGNAVAARKSRMLPSGHLEIITYMHGVEAGRTVFDMTSPPASEKG